MQIIFNVDVDLTPHWFVGTRYPKVMWQISRFSFLFSRLSLECAQKIIDKRTGVGIRITDSVRECIIDNGSFAQIYQCKNEQEEIQTAQCIATSSSPTRFNSSCYDEDTSKIAHVGHDNMEPEAKKPYKITSFDIPSVSTKQCDVADKIFSVATKTTPNNFIIDGIDRGVQKYPLKSQNPKKQFLYRYSKENTGGWIYKAGLQGCKIADDSKNTNFLEDIVTENMTSSKNKSTGEEGCPSSLESYRMCGFKEKYHHTGFPVHREFLSLPMKDFCSKKGLMKDSMESVHHHQDSKQSIDTCIEMSNQTNSPHMEHLISSVSPTDLLAGPSRIENAFFKTPAHQKPSNMEEQQNNPNTGGENMDSPISISCTEGVLEQRIELSDAECFRLMKNSILDLHVGDLGREITKFYFQNDYGGLNQDANIYIMMTKMDSSDFTMMPLPTKLEPSSFFFFGLKPIKIPMRKCFCISPIIIPITYHGFYQCNSSLHSYNRSITRYDSYFIVWVNMVLRRCNGDSYHKTSYHRGEVVFEETDDYTHFLKNIFLIRHGNQKLLVRLWKIINGELRFSFYEARDEEKLKFQLKIAVPVNRCVPPYISQKTRARRRQKCKYMNAQSGSEPSPQTSKFNSDNPHD